MPSYNHVTLMGNLTRDPELTYLPNGTALCNLSIAVNRKWRDKQTQEMKEDVSFIDCVAWARAAETICEYLKKGNPVLVDGELRQERWQDKETGGNRSKLKVHIKSFQFVGRRENAPASQEASQEPSNEIPW